MGITRQQVGKVINTSLVNKEFGGMVLSIKSGKIKVYVFIILSIAILIECLWIRIVIFEGNDYKDNMELLE